MNVCIHDMCIQRIRVSVENEWVHSLHVSLENECDECTT